MRYFLKKSTVFQPLFFIFYEWGSITWRRWDKFRPLLWHQKKAQAFEKSSLLHHHIPVWDTALGRIWSKKRPFVLRQVLNISASFEKVFPAASKQEEPLENAASMTWMPNKKIQGAIAAVTAATMRANMCVPSRESLLLLHWKSESKWNSPSCWWSETLNAAIYGSSVLETSVKNGSETANHIDFSFYN